MQTLPKVVKLIIQSATLPVIRVAENRVLMDFKGSIAYQGIKQPEDWKMTLD